MLIYIYIFFTSISTNGTKKLWDFKIAADIQKYSKIQIYVYIYVI